MHLSVFLLMRFYLFFFLFISLLFILFFTFLFACLLSKERAKEGMDGGGKKDMEGDYRREVIIRIYCQKIIFNKETKLKK